MRAGQVTQAHEEFAGDLAAGEAEGLLEQSYPFGLRQRMLRLPLQESAKRIAQIADRLFVVDRGIDSNPPLIS
jgi:hypothetical protein